MRDLQAIPTLRTLPPLRSHPPRRQADCRLHQQIESALARFGDDLLTTREQDVVQLILLGVPAKVAATMLRIAPKTEGVHRRNAYAKLGVNSQAALFRQFLAFLSVSWVERELSAGCGDDGDHAPL